MRYLCQFLFVLAIFGSTVAYAGDGFDVFFDGSGHVFNIFHHNNTTAALDCHDRKGQSCGPGWPYYFNQSPNTTTPVWNTSFTPTGWADDTNKRIWFQTATTAATGFACIDISTIGSPTYCFGSKAAAFKQMGNSPNYPWPSWSPDGVNSQVNVGSKLYAFESGTGKLLCMDASQATSTNSGACAGQPFRPLPTTTLATQYAGNSPGVNGWSGQLIAAEGKLYGFIGNSPTNRTSVFGVCWDSATDTSCSGFPKAISAYTNNIYELPDTDGNLLGVCFVNATGGGTGQTSQCFNSSGASVVDNSGFASKLATVYDKASNSTTRRYYLGWVNPPQRVGTRIFWVDGMWYQYNPFANNAWVKPSTNIQCYDVKTQSNCAFTEVADWPFNWPQTNSLVATGSGTTSWGESSWTYTDVTYALRVDRRPSGVICLWKNGDNTLIAPYDAMTAVPYGWFLGSQSVNTPINVCMDPNAFSGYATTTATNVVSTLNPSQSGQSVTFTATVSGVETKDSNGNVVTTRNPGGPTNGGVMFWVTPAGGTPRMACAAAAFSAMSPSNEVSCSYTFTQNGVYNVLAIYGGSIDFRSSNGTMKQYVGITPPAITADSPPAITYPTAVPAVGYTTLPVTVPSDWTTEPTCAVYATTDTSYTTPLTGAQLPGTYVTHCSGGASTKLTPVSNTNGSLVINKASVTMIADSPSLITYPAAVPSIGYTTSPSSTVADWSTQPTCAVYAAEDTSYDTPLSVTLLPGTYVTHCSGGVSGKYDPSSFADGSLVINKIATTVTASSPSTMDYPATVPTITYTTSPATTSEDWITPPTCAVYAASDTSFTTPLTGSLNSGTYVTHCYGGVSAVYGPTGFVDGSFVVSPPTQAQLTDTSATCTSVFLRSTAYPSLDAIYYSVKGNKINQINPGVFFYWAKIVLNSNGTVLTQSQIPFWGQYLSQASGSLLYDLSCNTVKRTSVSTTGGVTSVSGASAGTYYIAVKFSANDLSGITPNSYSPMTATFTSSRGAATVSLQVVRKDTGKP